MYGCKSVCVIYTYTTHSYNSQLYAASAFFISSKILGQRMAQIGTKRLTMTSPNMSVLCLWVCWRICEFECECTWGIYAAANVLGKPLTIWFWNTNDFPLRHNQMAFIHSFVHSPHSKHHLPSISSERGVTFVSPQHQHHRHHQHHVSFPGPYRQVPPSTAEYRCCLRPCIRYRVHNINN